MSTKTGLSLKVPFLQGLSQVFTDRRHDRNPVSSGSNWFEISSSYLPKTQSFGPFSFVYFFNNRQKIEKIQIFRFTKVSGLTCCDSNRRALLGLYARSGGLLQQNAKKGKCQRSILWSPHVIHRDREFAIWSLKLPAHPKTTK